MSETDSEVSDSDSSLSATDSRTYIRESKRDSAGEDIEKGTSLRSSPVGAKKTDEAKAFLLSESKNGQRSGCIALAGSEAGRRKAGSRCRSGESAN